MRIRLNILTAAATAAVMLSACTGGGGGGNTARTPDTAPPPAAAQSFNRNQATALGGGATTAARASNEPVSRNADQIFGFVGGVDINPLLAQIQRGCTRQSCYPASLSARHGGTEIGHIRIRDGVSANELLNYLRADADFRGGQTLRWGATPPVIRMVQGSTDPDKWHTELAVRLINSALPTNWQLRFDDTAASRAHEFEDGVIKVAFARRDQWPPGTCTGAIGCGYTLFTSGGEVTAGAAVVDPTLVTGERNRVFVLLHEILHTMGRGHVSPSAFPDTIMHAAGYDGQGDWLVLNRLDEAALHAIYSRFAPGTSTGDLDHSSLGPWNDVSTHVYARIGYIPGRFDAVVFGATWQNGNVRPYALALNPSPPLADGPRLGSATWSGRLVGLTPRAEAVTGAADMTVQLGTLRGALDFTGLEHWTAHAAPGAIGTGTQWGDGDLNYRIAVNGQVFYETGGDTGKVTGAFFGASHDKMGGTLRRHDLAAGFGAQRR